MQSYNNNDTNLLYNQHVMLLYENKNKRNNSIIDIINEGLKDDWLCIYASVDIDRSKGISQIEPLSSRIINYQENIEKENLKFINFKPYYESALKGDLTLFEKLKSELEYTIHNRISEGKQAKILFFADAAGHLSETRNFNECINLERWWQDVHSDWIRNDKDITVICPHPCDIFKKEPEQSIKNKISHFHDGTIDIENEYSLQYVDLIRKNKNFGDLINYEQVLAKTLKEIKYNFMDEHKNIIDIYHSIYSKQLDEVISKKLDISKTVEDYSNNLSSKINQNLLDNLTNSTNIINDIMVKNMDTFLKSIELVHKFYSDIVESYCNYIIRIKKVTER